jgi:hypothetical protein
VSGVVGIAWRGVRDLEKELDAIVVRADKATLAGLRANQNLIKRAVRKNLRGGAPRWGQRGASSRTGPEVIVGGGHNPRDGGPGVFVGDMVKGVGGVRRPKRTADEGWQGGVGIGRNINNLKKGRLELRFPFFAPAVKSSTPKFRETFEKAWSKAIHKK